MKVKLRRTRWRVGLFVALLALVLTGVAVAARALTSNPYTDASGAYHGCVNSTNGNLRVLGPGDSCRTHEVAIDWNQAGVAGPPGPPGSEGPRGPSNAYSINGADFTYLPAGQVEAVAATLTLPAGAYAISAKTTVADDADAFSAYVFCHLRADAGPNYSANSDESATQVGPDSRRQTVTMMLTHTFTAAGTATLECQTTNPMSGTNVVLEFSKIMAVQVASEVH